LSCRKRRPKLSRIPGTQYRRMNPPPSVDGHPRRDDDAVFVADDLPDLDVLAVVVAPASVVVIMIAAAASSSSSARVFDDDVDDSDSDETSSSSVREAPADRDDDDRFQGRAMALPGGSWW
jgi:hypothetical protein